MTATAADAAHWRRALRLLWSIGPRQVFGVLACAVVASAVPALNVALLTSAVQAVVDGAAGGATAAGAALAVLLAVGHVLGTVRGYLENILRQRMSDAVSERIMSTSVRLELADFEDPVVYDSLQRANREVGYRPYAIFTDLIGTLSQSITFLLVSAVLLSWHVGVALAVIVAPIPAILAQVRYSRVAYRVEHDRSSDRRRASYLQLLVTHDRTYKEVQLFELGAHLVDRYRRLVRGFFEVDRGIEGRNAVVSGLLGLLGVAASGAAVLIAVDLALRDGQIGRLAGYLTSIALVQAAVTGLFGGFAQLYEHNMFLGNLFSFLDIAERPRGRLGSSQPPMRSFPSRLSHGVRFKDVTFCYPGTTEPVLRGLDLFLPAGRSVALVGRNGVGKTTLVKLLAGFYRPTSGQILVDDTPLDEFDPADVRRHLGIIFQDFVQYEATARENIGFGRLSRMGDGSAVRGAAERAGAWELVRGLPGGLDAQLGRWFEDGHQLSGGEWQKIALARAFLRDAPLLVLDEPTASIDAAAEADLFGRIAEISGGATTLLIAHRFSTVRAADHIAVLDDGRVVEEGSHSELMAADGQYAHLFRLQAAGYLDG
jgi:ATP-binding cassette, subfamily B, bacterial